jgi:hypothetical protein
LIKTGKHQKIIDIKISGGKEMIITFINGEDYVLKRAVEMVKSKIPGFIEFYADKRRKEWITTLNASQILSIEPCSDIQL